MPERIPEVLVRDFDAWMLDRRGWSKQTRRTRRTTLGAARVFLHDARKVTLLSAHQEDVLAFLAQARHPRTRNRNLADLRAFYRFAIETGITRIDPCAGIERLREPRNLPRPINHGDAVRLLKAAALLSERAFVVVAIFLYAGLRIAEVSGLQWSDIDLEDQGIRVLGKGAKERIVPMSEHLTEILGGWRLRDGQGGTYVFPGQRHGRPLSTVTLWRDVSDAARLARVTVSPHRLRHTAASELLREGADIRRVQVFLGHASLATTQVYTQVLVEDLRPDVARLDFSE
ncbi:MAG: tyrosine-type recombinase/integrase [Actinomycetota bacterium]